MRARVRVARVRALEWSAVVALRSAVVARDRRDLESIGCSSPRSNVMSVCARCARARARCVCARCACARARCACARVRCVCCACARVRRVARCVRARAIVLPRRRGLYLVRAHRLETRHASLPCGLAVVHVVGQPLEARVVGRDGGRVVAYSELLARGVRTPSRARRACCACRVRRARRGESAQKNDALRKRPQRLRECGIAQNRRRAQRRHSARARRAAHVFRTCARARRRTCRACVS